MAWCEPKTHGDKKTQPRAETSPLAIAIVEALHPWPCWPEEAYAIVDDLLEGVRRAKRRQIEMCERREKEFAEQKRELEALVADAIHLAKEEED